jgi:Tfp pilus assembly protein FimT
MVEILLVLGVLALVMAIAWPNVLRLSSQQTLNDASEKVRALVASARVHAIESGLVYQVRYEPGGHHFLVIPFESEFEAVSPNARGTGTAAGLGRFTKAAGTLPKSVVFSAPVSTAVVNSTATSAISLSAGQQVSANALNGLPDAATLATLSWTGPILFHPNGTSADTQIDLIDKHHQRVSLRIRGLTGAVTVSRLQEVPRP